RSLARSILEELIEVGRRQWVGVDGQAPVTSGNAVEPRPMVEWAVESLARLHEADGRSTAVVDLLVDAAKLPFEYDLARAMRHRAARTAMDAAGDVERALTLWLELFGDDPHDTTAIDRLVITYESHERLRDLLSLRERQIAATVDAD